MWNVYVVAIFAPGPSQRICTRLESSRPQTVAVGDLVTVRDGRGTPLRLRVTSVEESLAKEEGRMIHLTMARTALASTNKQRTTQKSQPRPAAVDCVSGVTAMPLGGVERSVVTDFLRFHVFVRVFDGNADRWLASLQEREDSQERSADIRFVRWLRGRLRRDPSLLPTIRHMVEETPFWSDMPVTGRR